MSKKGSETDFKHWIRSAFAWSDTVEQRSGGTVGHPDINVLVYLSHPQGTLVPIEAKRAEIVKGVWKLLEPVNPAQYAWHYRFASKGGTAALMLGVWDESRNMKDKWSAMIIPGRHVQGWRSGYRPSGISQPVVHFAEGLGETFTQWLKNERRDS